MSEQTDDRGAAFWSVGDHWQEAGSYLDTARSHSTHEDRALWVSTAQAHLDMARLLLDHPPVDVLDAYPVERGVEPPKDWRDS